MAHRPAGKIGEFPVRLSNPRDDAISSRGSVTGFRRPFMTRTCNEKPDTFSVSAPDTASDDASETGPAGSEHDPEMIPFGTLSIPETGFSWQSAYLYLTGLSGYAHIGDGLDYDPGPERNPFLARIRRRDASEFINRLKRRRRIREGR